MELTSETSFDAMLNSIGEPISSGDSHLSVLLDAGGSIFGRASSLGAGFSGLAGDLLRLRGLPLALSIWILFLLVMATGRSVGGGGDSVGIVGGAGVIACTGSGVGA